jgi:hypothetical protein
MMPGDGSDPLQHKRALREKASQTYLAICPPLYKPYDTETPFPQASNALVRLVKGTH